MNRTSKANVLPTFRRSTDHTIAGQTAQMTLYHYWRSTSSWRVRWILAHKGITPKYVHINLLDDETQSAEYLEKNPMGYVPVLEVPTVEKNYLLTESTAIAEWLEEVKPLPSLFPKNSYERAKMRAYCETINAGIQPLVNLSVLEHLTEDKEARKKWSQDWIRRGFRALESQLKNTSGNFCLGNTFTLADIYLVPQCYAAARNDVNLVDFPLIAKINETALRLDTATISHPDQFKPA